MADNLAELEILDKNAILALLREIKKDIKNLETRITTLESKS